MILCELFVNKLECGFIGVAYASNVTDLVCFIMINILASQSKKPEIRAAWIKFSFEDIFFELPEFIKIAFAGLLLHCFESWSEEGLLFMSGLISAVSQSAMVLSFSFQNFMAFVPLSFSYAISALVGAALGQGKVGRAK